MAKTAPPSSGSWLLSSAALLAVMAAVGPNALAQDDLQDVSGEDLVKTKVFASVEAIHPGEQFEIAVRYEMTPHWHIYWSNPGESGMAPTISINPPEGFEVGAIQWPTPEVFRSSDVTYGYAKEVVLLVPVKAPDTLDPADLSIEVVLDWLVCRKVCLFGTRTHEIKLAIARPGRDVPAGPAEQRLLSQWRARMPIPMKKATGAVAQIRRGHLLLHGPAGSSKPAWFYPDNTPGVQPTTNGPVQGQVVGGRYIFDIPLAIEPENALGQPLRAAGLVVLGDPGGARTLRSIAIDIPIPKGEEASPTDTTEDRARKSEA